MMIERRPHWDDELIESVTESIPYPFPEIVIYSVIAAVEDWELGFHAQTEGVTHSAECWRWHYECARTLIEQQRAAIQRVRELHHFTVDTLTGPGGLEDIEHCQECGYISVDAESCPTIRVLDGERDD